MLADFHFPSAPLECPLGHECTRCLLYVPAKGTDPYTGKPIDDYECAIVLNAIMSGDNGRMLKGLHAAISQQTNETVKRQDEFLQLASGGRPRAIRQD